MGYMDAWKRMQQENPRDWGRDWVNACQPQPQPFQVLGNSIEKLARSQGYKQALEQHVRIVAKRAPEIGTRVYLSPYSDKQARFFRWAKRALKVARFMGCEVHA